VRSVCADLFQQKKKVEKMTSGGKDLASFLSTSSFQQHPFRFQCFPISVSINQLVDDDSRTAAASTDLFTFVTNICLPNKQTAENQLSSRLAYRFAVNCES
jgi:hypothetical protein